MTKAKLLTLAQLHAQLDSKLKRDFHNNYAAAAADAKVSYSTMFKTSHWTILPGPKMLKWLKLEEVMIDGQPYYRRSK